VDAGSREENASKQNLDPVLIPSEPKKLWDRSSRGDWSSISGWLQKDLQPAFGQSARPWFSTKASAGFWKRYYERLASLPRSMNMM
jgi:hypothetical protein